MLVADFAEEDEIGIGRGSGVPFPLPASQGELGTCAYLEISEKTLIIAIFTFFEYFLWRTGASLGRR